MASDSDSVLSFQMRLKDIGRNMSEEDTRLLKFMCSSRLSGQDLAQTDKDGVRLVSKLQKYGLVSEKKTLFLGELLVKVGRPDLAEILHYRAGSPTIKTNHLEFSTRENVFGYTKQFPIIEGVSSTVWVKGKKIIVYDMDKTKHMIASNTPSLKVKERTHNDSSFNLNPMSPVLEIMEDLKSFYRHITVNESPFEWMKSYKMDLKTQFFGPNLVIRERRKCGYPSEKNPKEREVSERYHQVTLNDIFNADNGISNRTLIEAEPGMGKTKLCLKLASDWSHGERVLVKRFKGIFLINSRYLSSDLPTTLCEQLCFAPVQFKMQVWPFIKENEKNILFILDGFDEINRKLPNDIADLVSGKILSSSCVLLTSRTDQWQSKFGRKINVDKTMFDTVVTNLGLVEEAAFSFIRTFSQKTRACKEPNGEADLCRFLEKRNASMDLLRSPLNCLFLCIMWDEGCLSQSQHQPLTNMSNMHAEMLKCIARKFCKSSPRQKYKLLKDGNSLPVACLEKLKQTHKIAYYSLREGKYQVSFKDIQRYLSGAKIDEKDDLFNLGILVEIWNEEEKMYIFPHRILQEELGAEFYSGSAIREIDRSSHAARNLAENPLMAKFCFGLVHYRQLDPQLLEPLIEEMFGYLNDKRPDTKKTPLIALECLYESNYLEQLTTEISKSLSLDRELRGVVGEFVARTGFHCLRLKGVQVKDVSLNGLPGELLKIHCSELASVLLWNKTVKTINFESCDFIYRPNNRSHSLSEGFEMNSTLTYLNLNECQFSHGSCEQFSDGLRVNNVLKTLSLSACKIYSKGWVAFFAGVEKNSSITNLNLSSCTIPDMGWNSFRRCLAATKTIKILNIYDLRVPNASLGEGLEVNTSLTQLIISECTIADKAWQSLGVGLKVNCSLKDLFFGDRENAAVDETTAFILPNYKFDVNKKGWRAFGDMFEANKGVTDFEWYRCDISEKGCRSMKEGIKLNKTLLRMRITECNFRDTGWKHFFRGLESNGKLNYMNIVRCSINDEGCEALGDVLASNKYLANLVLLDCQIGAEGWVLLSEGLKSSGGLAELDLCRCHIPESAYRYIFEMLKLNSKLVSLVLRGGPAEACQIPEEGWKALSECLRVNRPLTSLNLSYCQISDPAGWESVADAFKSNPRLREFYIDKQNTVAREYLQVLGDRLIVLGSDS